MTSAHLGNPKRSILICKNTWLTSSWLSCSLANIHCMECDHFFERNMLMCCMSCAHTRASKRGISNMIVYMLRPTSQVADIA